MPGRRPKPTTLRKLQGDAGHRPLNDKEPEPPIGEPKMPANLGPLAKQEWKSIVAKLTPLGMLSTIDGKALAAYCHAFESWVEANIAVVVHGIVVKEPIFNKEGVQVGSKLKRNPADVASQSWLKIMKSFLVEFGMTPSSRSRLRVDKPAGEEKDPFESFMNRGGKQNKHLN